MNRNGATNDWTPDSTGYRGWNCAGFSWLCLSPTNFHHVSSANSFSLGFYRCWSFLATAIFWRKFVPEHVSWNRKQYGKSESEKLATPLCFLCRKIQGNVRSFQIFLDTTQFDIVNEPVRRAEMRSSNSPCCWGAVPFFEFLRRPAKPLRFTSAPSGDWRSFEIFSLRLAWNTAIHYQGGNFILRQRILLGGKDLPKGKIAELNDFLSFEESDLPRVLSASPFLPFVVSVWNRFRSSRR